MAVLRWFLLLSSCLLATASDTLLQRRTMGKDHFVEECKAYLMSDELWGDGFISQNDFADFVTTYCIAEAVCEPETVIYFTELSVQLQLTFVYFICDGTTEDERRDCLEELLDMGAEFGYQESIDTEAEVTAMCEKTYQYTDYMGLVSPTIAPSVETMIPTIVGATIAPIIAPGEQAPASAPAAETPQEDGISGGEGIIDGGGGTERATPARTSVSAGLIAGVSIAGFILLSILFLVLRRKRKTDVGIVDSKDSAEYDDVAGDESIFTEDSAAFRFMPKGLNFGGSVKSSSRGSSSDKNSSSDASSAKKGRSVAQYDSTSAAAAVALASPGNDENRDSAMQLGLADTREEKIHNLDAAIDVADWDAVAQIAETLASRSDSEGASSISGVSSTFSRSISDRSMSTKSRASLTEEEAALASQIDELVQRGDWNAVATAAEVFSNNKDAEGGNSNIVAPSPERRSFLDFVTGRRAASSSAAAAAAVGGSQIVPADDSSEGGKARVGPAEEHTSGRASLSEYASARTLSEYASARTTNSDFQSARTDLSDADQVPLVETMDTRSSSSPGSPPTGESGAVPKSPPKKRWKSLFTSKFSPRKSSSTSRAAPPTIGGKDELNKSLGTSSSHAVLRTELDEAVARGDWAGVEAISAKIEASTARKSGGDSSMGNLRKLISKKGLSKSEKNDLSLGRSASPGGSIAVSQRAELDNAVARGDWDEVERLTTQMLDNSSTSSPQRPVMTGSEILTETLLDRVDLQAAKSTPAGSPFRETPASSEWSQSPIEKEKMDKIHQLINAGDWKGVHVLSGMFEMEENGTIPPTFASMSADSAEKKSRAAAGTSTPTSDAAAQRPPPSPATSSSAGSVDIKEFQKFVNEKDWRGLAAFAGAEETEQDDDEDVDMRDLFQSPLPGAESKDEADQKPPAKKR